MELRDAADEHRLGQRAEPACQLRAREAQLIGDQVQVVDVVLTTRRVRQALGARLRPTLGWLVHLRFGSAGRVVESHEEAQAASRRSTRRPRRNGPSSARRMRPGAR